MLASMAKENLNEKRSQGTREKLLKTGRNLFASKGFAKVSAEELVTAAGLTRGALYHHFEGKSGLFAGVYEKMQQEMAARVEKMVAAEPGPWEELTAGIMAYLAACEKPDIQRIFFEDGPAVLGWERCREIDARHTMALLERGIADAMRNGELDPLPLKPLMLFLAGALREAGMWIASSREPNVAKKEAAQVLGRVFSGIRKK
jgi:AcrR family transcriptional regulator